MYSEIVIARLHTCLEHIRAIEIYSNDCTDAETFFSKNNGANYDGSLMRLQALGERLKSISKKHPFVIDDLSYPEINSVIRFRDYVSHHYEQLEHESVFEICRYKIPELKVRMQKILSEKES